MSFGIPVGNTGTNTWCPLATSVCHNRPHTDNMVLDKCIYVITWGCNECWKLDIPIIRSWIFRLSTTKVSILISLICFISNSNGEWLTSRKWRADDTSNVKCKVTGG